MNISQNLLGTTVEFLLSGKFTFSDHDSFRTIIEKIKDSNTKSVIIDFSGVDFIDSAALGMLLIAREEGDKYAVQISLRGAQGQIEKMFKVSKFDSLFTLI